MRSRVWFSVDQFKVMNFSGLFMEYFILRPGWCDCLRLLLFLHFCSTIALTATELYLPIFIWRPLWTRTSAKLLAGTQLFRKKTSVTCCVNFQLTLEYALLAHPSNFAPNTVPDDVDLVVLRRIDSFNACVITAFVCVTVWQSTQLPRALSPSLSLIISSSDSVVQDWVGAIGELTDMYLGNKSQAHASLFVKKQGYFLSNTFSIENITLLFIIYEAFLYTWYFLFCCPKCVINLN